MKSSFQDYFRTLIGDVEAEAFFESIRQRQTRRAVRVNTLKVSKAALREWLEAQGYTVSDSPFSRDGLELSGRGERLALKLPYHAGFTYPQDPSSMFAVELLDPQPGERVADLTAAPGGKTTHIAQRMQNTGVLLANDMDTRRLKALHSNLERLGIWNTVVTRMKPYKLSQQYAETFDRVLLDPSCSGEGLLVTPEGKPKFWNTKSLKRYCAEQTNLLCSAFRMLKPGGRLVYSTCTLNALEDDGVVERLLKKFPEAAVETVAVPGAPEQIGDLKGFRFWPHKTQTKGFFCIAITKTQRLGLQAEPVHSDFRRLKKKQRLAHEIYLQKHFEAPLPEVDWVLRDEHLFWVSPAVSAFPLPARYSLSFPVAKVYDGVLRPTHAGALWLGQHGRAHVQEVTRQEVESIFEGERCLDYSHEAGFFVLRYRDFALGLAKQSPKGLELLLPHQY